MSNYREELKEAIASAKSKVKLVDYATNALGIEMKGQYCTCPFCGKKAKMMIKTTARCFSSCCDGNQSMDAISFHMKLKGCDYREASTAFLAYANVEHPWERFKRTQQKKGM
jgi:CHC2 zinc finger